MNLQETLELHAKWVKGEDGGRWANLTGANLTGANLTGADLRGADLGGANITGANLRGANLGGANLERADLGGANLERADLRWANLRWANLERADLRWANLERADLGDANLERAYLRWANLTGANLGYAYLGGANLGGANLTGTCLDPNAEIPTVSDDEILGAGLEIEGEYVCGWRTKRSQHVGSNVYEPGVYTAPVFSVDAAECHPGIYISSEKWLRENYPDEEIVRCRTLRKNLHRAGGKWRTRELEII